MSSSVPINVWIMQIHTQIDSFALKQKWRIHTVTLTQNQFKEFRKQSPGCTISLSKTKLCEKIFCSRFSHEDRIRCQKKKKTIKEKLFLRDYLFPTATLYLQSFQQRLSGEYWQLFSEETQTQTPPAPLRFGSVSKIVCEQSVDTCLLVCMHQLELNW